MASSRPLELRKALPPVSAATCSMVACWMLTVSGNVRVSRSICEDVGRFALVYARLVAEAPGAPAAGHSEPGSSLWLYGPVFPTSNMLCVCTPERPTG